MSGDNRQHQEVDTSTRIMLYNPESATQPSGAEYFHCFRSMWTWPLHYGAVDYGVVQEEVRQSRRDCRGFYRYRPGWSPIEHRELVLKASENRFRVWLAILSAAIGVLVGFIIASLKK